MIARRFRGAWLAVLVLPGMLAACDVYRHDDEPGYQSPAPEPVAPPPPVAESSGGREVIKPGQTLYGVAREHDLPLRALIDANGLEPPYKLKVGQVLTIPSVRQTTVQPGETLGAVARRNEVEESTLARVNHLEPPYQLKAGAKLILPESAEVAAVAPTRPMAPLQSAPPAYIPPPAPASSAPPYIPPPPPSSPSASGRFGATPLPPPGPAAVPATPSAAPLPPMKPPPPAAVPAETPPPEPAVPPPPPTAAPVPPPAVASAPPTRLEPPPAPVAPPPPPEKAPPPAPKSPPVAASPPEPEEAPPAAAEAASPAAVAAIVQSHKPPTAPLFNWPVRGSVVSTFGPAAGGTHNDGINISAPEGTEVDAADSGVVAYAGNELKGFGNLLLIKHADGWVTAYAHNKELLVAKGDHVRRGQAIARVGATGGVTKPQLHFELRQKTTAVDPLDHLPPAGAD